MVGAAQRAGDLHPRGGGEAAVQRVVVDHLPAPADFLQAYHAGAVGVDLFADFFGRALAVDVSGRAGGVQGCRVDVFKVDGQQAVFGAAIDREEVHAVMVHAHCIGLVGRGVAAIGLPRVAIAVQRGAPRRQHIGAVACCDDTGIGARAWDGLEAQCQFRDFRFGYRWLGHRWFGDRIIVIGTAITVEAACQAGPGDHGDGGAQAAAHDAAAAQVGVHDAGHRQIAAVVPVQVVAGISTHQGVLMLAELEETATLERKYDDSLAEI